MASKDLCQLTADELIELLGLAPLPEDRYPDAGAVLAALEPETGRSAAPAASPW